MCSIAVSVFGKLIISALYVKCPYFLGTFFVSRQDIFPKNKWRSTLWENSKITENSNKKYVQIITCC